MKKIILILLFLILISFKTGDNKSSYTVPRAAWSVTAGDIDMDGDNDIVVGHCYSSQTNWTGISVLSNDGFGSFIIDSIYLNGQHRKVELQQLNFNETPDLITQVWNNINSQIGIIFDSNFNQSSILTIDINDYADYIVTGDINNNDVYDIVVASNSGQFWGILYNDGNGNFSDPEYHYVTDYYPTDIACGDLNGDGRDDVVVAGADVEIYYSYASGFQQYQLSEHELKVKIIDFDNDGDNDIIGLSDLYMAGCVSISIYENLQNGNFHEHNEYLFQPSGDKLIIADFNNDSLFDILVVLNNMTGHNLIYNLGNNTLDDPVFIPVDDIGEDWRNCYCADMDGNGYNDIITLRCSFMHLDNNLSILFNDGNGNFQENPIVNIQPSNIELQKSNLSCYPNPSRSFGTTISFSLEKNTFVTLQILDIKGTFINTLINKELLSGKHKIIWNGKTLNGKKVNAGLYLVRLKSGWNIYTQRIVVNK